MGGKAPRKQLAEKQQRKTQNATPSFASAAVYKAPAPRGSDAAQTARDLVVQNGRKAAKTAKRVRQAIKRQAAKAAAAAGSTSAVPEQSPSPSPDSDEEPTACQDTFRIDSNVYQAAGDTPDHGVECCDLEQRFPAYTRAYTEFGGLWILPPPALGVQKEGKDGARRKALDLSWEVRSVIRTGVYLSFNGNPILSHLIDWEGCDDTARSWVSLSALPVTNLARLNWLFQNPAAVTLPELYDGLKNLAATDSTWVDFLDECRARANRTLGTREYRKPCRAYEFRAASTQEAIAGATFTLLASAYNSVQQWLKRDHQNGEDAEPVFRIGLTEIDAWYGADKDTGVLIREKQQATNRVVYLGKVRAQQVGKGKGKQPARETSVEADWEDSSEDEDADLALGFGAEE